MFFSEHTYFRQLGLCVLYVGRLRCRRPSPADKNFHQVGLDLDFIDSYWLLYLYFHFLYFILLLLYWYFYFLYLYFYSLYLNFYFLYLYFYVCTLGSSFNCYLSPSVYVASLLSSGRCARRLESDDVKVEKIEVFISMQRYRQQCCSCEFRCRHLYVSVRLDV